MTVDVYYIFSPVIAGVNDHAALKRCIDFTNGSVHDSGPHGIATSQWLGKIDWNLPLGFIPSYVTLSFVNWYPKNELFRFQQMNLGWLDSVPCTGRLCPFLPWKYYALYFPQSHWIMNVSLTGPSVIDLLSWSPTLKSTESLNFCL